MTSPANQSSTDSLVLEKKKLTTPTASTYQLIIQSNIESSLFSADQIYIAFYCSDQDNPANNYYITKDGTGVCLAPGSKGTSPITVGSPIPTFPLTKLNKQNAISYALTLPQELTDNNGNVHQGLNSARLYVSCGSPPQCIVNDDYSVTAPSTTDSKYYFDYVELAFNLPSQGTGGLNIDTTQVDGFGLPLTLVVTTNSGGNTTTYSTGVVNDIISRTGIINQFNTYTQNTPFAPLATLVSSGSYGTYRILNPNDYLVQQNQNSLTGQTAVVAQPLLASGANLGDTSITVTSGGGFPGFEEALISPGQVISANFVISINENNSPSETATVTSITALSKSDSSNFTFKLQNPLGNTYVNNTTVAMTSPMTASQNSIRVAKAPSLPKSLPSIPFYIQVDQEIMQVIQSFTNIDATSSYTWNVTRGIYPSVAATHSADPNNKPATAFLLAPLDPLNNYFNSAIDALFAAVRKNGLTLYVSYVSPTGANYTGQYTATVTQGNGVWAMQFTPPSTAPDTSPLNVYYPFFQDNAALWLGYQPKLLKGAVPPLSPYDEALNISNQSPSMMVFGCNGCFADQAYQPSLNSDQQTVLATIENQIVSALNRGVALLPGYNSSSPGTGDWGDSSQYYKTNQPYNLYAAFFHNIGIKPPGITINGQAYAFPFDDQTNQSTDISVPSFTNATIVIQPFKYLPI